MSKKQKQKHTPGPWSHGFIESGWGLTPRVKIQDRCLLFIGTPDDSNANILPSQADARLIAAAPDLHEAAFFALFVMLNMTLVPTTEEHDEAVKTFAKAQDMLLAALEKVEGK